VQLDCLALGATSLEKKRPQPQRNYLFCSHALLGTGIVLHYDTYDTSILSSLSGIHSNSRHNSSISDIRCSRVGW